MSAKAKTKKTESAGPIIIEASAIAETPPPEAPPPAAEPTPAPPTLIARVRAVTGKAVVTTFARVRAAQTTTVQKTLAWITAIDAGLSKSLIAGEQFLLTRLQRTPE